MEFDWRGLLARAVARGRVRHWIDRVVGTSLIAAGVSVLRLRRAVQ